MIEYICEAVEKGYAKKVPHASGALFVCNAPECAFGYKILRNLCKVDGMIPGKKPLGQAKNKGLAEKLTISL